MALSTVYRQVEIDTLIITLTTGVLCNFFPKRSALKKNLFSYVFYSLGMRLFLSCKTGRGPGVKVDPTKKSLQLLLFKLKKHATTFNQNRISINYYPISITL